MKIQEILESKIITRLQPDLLKVINESPNHNVPEGSESHFRVIVVSKKFDGLSTIKRHQMIYEIIDEELKQKVHAFSQHTLTPQEWLDQGGELPSSPPCIHKSDKK